MAENTIDTLALEISSNAASASKGLDRLTASLMGIDKATKRGVSGLSNFSTNITSFASSINSVNFSGLSTMSKGLNDFANVAQNLSRVKVGDIGKAITRIKKLESLKNIDLSGISASLQPLQNADFSAVVNLGNALQGLVSNLAGAEKVSTGTTRIVTSVTQLASSAGTIPTVTSALPGLSSEILNFVKAVSTAPQIDAGTASIVSSLSGIASSGIKAQKVASALPEITKGVSEFIATLSRAPKLNNNVVKAVNSLSQLSTAGRSAGTASRSLTGNITKLSSSMGGLFSNISRAVGGLSTFGSSAQKAQKRTGGLVSSIAKLYAAYFSVTRGVKALWGSVESASNYIETLNYFNASFGQVASIADLSSWSELGYKSAEAYANSFEERAKELTKKLTGFQVSESGDLSRTSFASLGLDPDKTMQYQATFAQMASSMGATADVSLKLSNALTMIGADLASVRNMEFEDVWQDMASGMVGMSRTLDKYGVNIRNVNLQQALYNLGIDKSISKLNQQEKAILRTVVLLNNTKYAWGDLANTINQPANQLRLLQANFTSLSRTIGSLFLPIVAKVLPFINALVIAIQRLFAWLGKLLGVKVSDFSSSIGGSAVDMGDLADESEGAAGNIDDAADSAKKLEKSLSLLPFDRLNQLSKQPVLNDTTGSGTPGASTGAGLDDMSALESALDASLAEYQKAWDAAFSKMENDANDMAEKIVGVFKRIAETAKPTTDAIKSLWNDGLKKLGDFSWDTIKDFWNNFLKPMGTWMLSDESGLPRFFNITNDLLNEIDWEKLNGSLDNFFTSLKGPAEFVWTSLMDFYEKFLKPLSVWTMSEAVPQLVDALTRFNKNIDWKGLNDALSNFWSALAPFAQSVGQGLVNFFKDMLSIGEGFLNTTLPDGLNSIAEKIRNISPETAEKVGAGLGKIALALAGFKLIGSVAKTFSSLFGKDSALITGLNLIKGIPYLGTVAGLLGIAGALEYFGVIDVNWEFLWNKLKDIKDILAEFIDKINWETIKDGLGKLWTAFQPFAEGFADGLIDALDFIINKIGAPLINGIAGAFELFASALDMIPDDLLYVIGAGLGSIAAGLISINVAKDGIEKLKDLFSLFNGSDIRDAVENAAGGIESIGTAAETVATGGVSLLKVALGGVAEGGLIGALAIGAQKLTEFLDLAMGGNGKLSDLGLAVHEMSGKLQESHAITDQERLAMFALKEELENSQATTEEFAQAFIEKLKECHVSNDQFKTAINELGLTFDATKEQADFFDLVMQGLGDSSEDMAGKFILSSKDGEKAFQTIKDAMYNTGAETGTLTTVVDDLIRTFDQTYRDTGNVDSAILAVKKSLEDTSYMVENADGTFENLSDRLDVDVKEALKNAGIAVGDFGTVAETADGKTKGLSDKLNTGVVKSFENVAEKAGAAAEKTSAVEESTGKVETSLNNAAGKADSMATSLGSIGTQGEGAGTAVSTLDTDLSLLSDGIPGYMEKMNTGGSDLTKNFILGMQSGFSENSSLVTDEAQKVAKGVPDLIESTWGINSPSTVAADEAKKFLAGLGKGFSEGKEEALGNVKTLLSEIEKLFPAEDKNFKGFGISYMTEFGSGISETEREVISTQQTFITNLKSIFPGYNSDFKGYGQSFMSELASGMTSMQENLSTVAKNIATTIKDNLDIGDSLKSKGQSIIRSFVNGMQSVHIPAPYLTFTTSTTINGNSATTSTQSFSGWKANGGFFDRPTIIGVGEAGREIALPLDNKRVMRTVSNSIMENASHQFVDTGAVEGAVERAVSRAMMRNSNNQPINVYATLKTENDEVLARAVTRGQKKLDYRMNPTPQF